MYDAIGNPLTFSTRTYTWQHGRQLAQTSKDGETVSFVYNEDGLRVQKTATSTGITKYTLHGKNIVHLTNGNNELHFFYDAQGRVAVVECNGVPYRYVHNLQGDVVALIDAEGNKVVEYWYDAWGKPLSKTGAMAETLGTVQPFRYRGYVWDEETGLYYLRSRYYRPEWGRFVNNDSYIDKTGKAILFNTFAYCSNCPPLKVDIIGNKDIYVFYYYRPTSKHPLDEQAFNLAYIDYSAPNIHMIEVGYTRQFINKWNEMDDADLDSVYFILHGSPGRISFDESNNEYVAFANDGGDGSFNELSPKKVSRAIYMFNCEGAKEVNGVSVASFFSKLCKTDVYACVCGVSYTRIPYYKDKYLARETETSFLMPLTSNWRWFHYNHGKIDEYCLLSKWFNGTK